jgi:hypothetical protein
LGVFRNISGVGNLAKSAFIGRPSLVTSHRGR